MDPYLWANELEMPRNPLMFWGGLDHLSLSEGGLQAGVDSFVPAETPLDSEVDVVKKTDSRIGDGNQSKNLKRKCGELQPAPSNCRQRGKNWKEIEENILVESKGKGKDWRAISEYLKDNGFTRNDKHCTDKWYALRKHYLDIHEWIAHHPEKHYWSLSDSDRIRTVPNSFCERWYEIFDAAEKREGRKHRRRNDNEENLAMETPSPSGANLGGVPSTPMSRIDTCAPGHYASLGHPQFSQRYVDSSFLGDATHGNECPETGDFSPNHDAFSNQTSSTAEIRMLLKEIRGLTNFLQNKFAKEEEERTRNFRLEEQKLDLEQKRFELERQKYEDARRTRPQHFDGFDSL